MSYGAVAASGPATRHRIDDLARQILDQVGNVADGVAVRQ